MPVHVQKNQNPLYFCYPTPLVDIQASYRLLNASIY